MRSLHRAFPVFTVAFLITAFFSVSSLAMGLGRNAESRRFLVVTAPTVDDRTTLVELGFDLIEWEDERVGGLADKSVETAIREKGYKIEVPTLRGPRDFPRRDRSYHNYDEMTAALKKLAETHSDVARLHVIGKSYEGRNIWALQINSDPADLHAGNSMRPGAFFFGAHHAREHLSVEIPLMLAQHVLAQRGKDPDIDRYIRSRDIWITPMVNPDGAEWDISTGRYKMWRKTRSKNRDGSRGVDPNRNYSYMWGTGGSSKNPRSDVYMGPEPFSEPETRTIRDFVKARPNITFPITFHTFSELILYPNGHTRREIDNKKDLRVFKSMAKAMARFNGYRPMQASDLYVASGTTSDWMYGDQKRFGFTFELSPKSMRQGGFYPGPIQQRVFRDNLDPCLLVIEYADNPYRFLEENDS